MKFKWTLVFSSTSLAKQWFVGGKFFGWHRPARLDPDANRFSAFNATVDFALGRNLTILGELLDANTKVALVYGDLDYRCSWYVGEVISDIISSSLSPAFGEVGYTDIHVNDTYIVGIVRQADNLSVTSVFQAERQVSNYQRETGFKIIEHDMTDKDIVTGNVSTADNGEQVRSLYRTEGPLLIADVSHEVPSRAPNECYLWNIYQTCTQNQIGLIAKGQAIFKDYIMVGTKGSATINVSFQRCRIVYYDGWKRPPEHIAWPFPIGLDLESSIVPFLILLRSYNKEERQKQHVPIELKRGRGLSGPSPLLTEKRGW